MNSDPAKVSPSHLRRDAYLYVRQSTLRQVLENTESTQRQYALRERAIALGWPIERVLVIDCDQGQSGASAADREGFQRLVAELSLGHAGIVLGLEVSRLARRHPEQGAAGGTQDAVACRIGRRRAGPGGPGSGPPGPGRAAGLVHHL
jgi:hypothetical protein